MLLGAFTAYLGHGLLVVGAPESTDPHDGWDPATENIHAVSDSIFVGVKDADSGFVTVTCIEGLVVETGLSQLFSGQLALPNARLEFSDPDGMIKMVVPVSEKLVPVVIYGNDSIDPSEVLVHVQVASDFEE
jgi:hypothetical protein